VRADGTGAAERFGGTTIGCSTTLSSKSNPANATVSKMWNREARMIPPWITHLPMSGLTRASIVCSSAMDVLFRARLLEHDAASTALVLLLGSRVVANLPIELPNQEGQYCEWSFHGIIKQHTLPSQKRKLICAPRLNPFWNLPWPGRRVLGSAKKSQIASDTAINLSGKS